jgi:general stress protein 26
MLETEPIAELNPGFSQPGATARPWADVVEVLDTSEMFWLSTTRHDGRPHVTPLTAIWLEGRLHFCAGDKEQKTKNLAEIPACILTTGTNKLHSGLDVVVEGIAAQVSDRARLEQLAALWLSKLDWPYTVGDGVFDDGQGHIGLVFAVEPAKILAFGKDPFSQTRYTFSP